jgi:hypothetical protein
MARFAPAASPVMNHRAISPSPLDWVDKTQITGKLQTQMSDISRSTVSIRLYGIKLDPEYLTQCLGCSPSRAAKSGDTFIKPDGTTRIVKKSFWLLSYGDSDAVDLEEKIELLFAKLTDNLDVWQEITKNAKVADLFCGLFIDRWNEGFELSPSIMKKISDRNLEIGFDIYTPTDSWNIVKEPHELFDE